MAGEVLSRDKRLSLRLYDEIIGVKLNCWRDGQHSVCEAFRWLLEERAEFLANEKILTQRAEAAEREAEECRKLESECENMAMMIRRISWQLAKYKPDATVLKQAKGYLEKIGRQGNILRDET